MNKVILCGNITNDLELRTVNDGKSVCQFTIAVNSGYGENKRTEFINCTIWNKQAENLAKYCSKGSKLLIEGRIQNSTYEDKEGNKKTSTRVLCEEVTFINTKKEIKEEVKENVDPYSSFGEENILEDSDLPF